MNFKIVILFSVFVSLTPLEVWSLKRIKRNSLKDDSNSRVKQDFVALHSGKPNSEEINNKHELKVSVIGTTSNSSNNHTLDLHKKRNVSRPLAVILRERERKINERQMADHKSAGISNTSADSKLANQAIDTNLMQSAMDKRRDGQENSKESHKHARNKHLPHMLQSTRVVGAHVIMPPQPLQPSFGVLNPIASLDELIRFGNTMMFKVGIDSLPYISQTNQQSYSPNMLLNRNSPKLQQQRHFYRQTNEPNFDYVFNSIEGPLDNKDEQAAIISNPTIYFKTPVSESEPTQMASLMQSALDTLLSNSDSNENEIECPIHVEKKSPNDDGVIQVCSCHFIKADKKGKQK